MNKIYFLILLFMYSIGIQSKENKIIHEHHEKSLNAYVENEYYIVINNGENVKEKNNGQIKRPHRNPSNVGILTLVFNSDFSNISICIKKNGDTVYYDNELSIKTFDIISINIKEFGSGLYSVQIKEEEKVLLEREIEID